MGKKKKIKERKKEGIVSFAYIKPATLMQKA